MIETTLPLVGVGIDAAVLYSQKGLETTSVGGVKTSMKTDYIDVPVNLNGNSAYRSSKRIWQPVRISVSV